MLCMATNTEVWDEPAESIASSSKGPAPALDQNEMDEVLQEVNKKVKVKKEDCDKRCCKVKMDCIVAGLKEMNIKQEVSPELQAAMVELLRQDKWNSHLSKLKFKLDEDKKGKSVDCC